MREHSTRTGTPQPDVAALLLSLGVGLERSDLARVREAQAALEKLGVLVRIRRRGRARPVRGGR